MVVLDCEDTHTSKRSMRFGRYETRVCHVSQRVAVCFEAKAHRCVHINQKLGGGFFGGEGFIMQKLTGSGTAFIECDGDFVTYELAAGQTMYVDTGNVWGFTGNVALEIERVHGAKNIMFGGEGLFNTKLTGPGTIWLQTMPLSGFVDAIAPHLPTTGN